jgi:hypothetical protein
MKRWKLIVMHNTILNCYVKEYHFYFWFSAYLEKIFFKLFEGYDSRIEKI